MPYERWDALAGLGALTNWDALAGLGDDSVDVSTFDPTDPSTWGDVFSPTAASANINAPISTGVPSGPSIAQDVQVGVQDAFQFAKLFNPIPAGCTSITGPNGVSELSCSTPTNPAPNIGLPSLSSMSSFLPILLIGVVALLAFGGHH